MLRFEDPAIVESSGLVARGGLLQTVNDSGDEARVFTVDRSGRTVGVSRWAGPAVDVEALAPGPPGRVWVGDIGDNAAERDDVSITSVPVGPGERTGPTRTFRLSYPGGPRRRRDAARPPAHRAAPRRHQGRPRRSGAGAPARPRLRPGQPVAAGRQRAGAGHRRGVPARRSPRRAARLQQGRRLHVPRDRRRSGRCRCRPQQQGEGLAVDGDGRLLVSSEGTRSPVLAVELPGRVARAVADDDSSRDRLSVTVPDEPDTEPVVEEPRPDVRSWLIGAGVLVVMVVVLVRSMRPR